MTDYGTCKKQKSKKDGIKKEKERSFGKQGILPERTVSTECSTWNNENQKLLR